MKKKKENNDTQGLTAWVPDIKINASNPFQNDKLHRKVDIKTLTKIVNAFKGGAVISVNGVWGSGKSIFLKLWKQFLTNKHYPVIYYNAWEDDISEEPLFSMIKNLKSIANTEDGSLDKLVEKAGKFLAGALFGAVKSVTGFWGKVLGDSINGGIEQIEKDCIDSLNSKDSTSSLLSDFKEALSDFVTDVASKGYKIPVVYFVDELDRCNPTFAVKVLERIKHLFEVDNVVFVLALDKEQFCHSINGYFGSESFNSEEYLKRFIDIEYTLQPTMSDDYCLRIFKHFHLDKTMNKKSVNRFVSFTNTCCDAFGLSCRQIEKAYSLYTVAIYCIGNKRYDFNLDLLFYLAAIKIRKPDLFYRIEKRNINEQELINDIERLYLEQDPDNIDFLNYCFCDVLSLLVSYYIEYRGLTYSNETEIDDIQFEFHLFTDSSLMDAIRNHLKEIYNMLPWTSGYLDYYIEKLRMINSFEREPELSAAEITYEIRETLKRLAPMGKPIERTKERPSHGSLRVMPVGFEDCIPVHKGAEGEEDLGKEKRLKSETERQTDEENS